MSWNQLEKRIASSKNILLSTHKNPDGDGLGSELSMYYYLKSINKSVDIINISDKAARYDFMDIDKVIKVYSDDLSIEEFDLVIVFDLGDYRRLGKLGDDISSNNIDVINIDHHVPRDDNFYFLSIVDIEAPATTYMIWKYFQFLNLTEQPLEKNIAHPLYVGLVNDTGSFRYSGVSSDTHIMASHLLLSDINPNKVFQHIYENRSIPKINLLSKMIDNLQYSQNGKVGYVVIDNHLFKEANATIEDADGLADFIRSIDGVEVAFSITSYRDTKVSLRSRGKYVINDIAQLLGGGGHYYASGAQIQKIDIDNTISIILKELEEKMSNGN